MGTDLSMFLNVAPGNEVVMKILLGVIILTFALAISLAIQYPIRRLLTVAERRKVGGSIFQNIVRVLVWGWAICAILDTCFGLDTAGMLAALGIVGVAISLGAQQTIANIIGGVIVSLSGMVGPNDWVTLDGHKEARVVDTSWRRTVLENEDKIQYAVPNALMVSSLIEKGNPYFMMVVPFAVKPTVPDLQGLLSGCEQVLLDSLVENGYDHEQMRPRAHMESSTLGAINCEVKLYVTREENTRVIKRAVLPALVNYLQENDAIADLAMLPATPGQAA